MRFLVSNYMFGRRRRATVLALLMLLAATAPLGAYATCGYANGSGPITLQAVFQGSITVGRDVPLGTEVYRTRSRSTSTVLIRCDVTSQYNYRYASLPYPRASYVHPVYGNNIYLTNVSGIGVVGWAGNNQPIPVGFNNADAGVVTNVNIHDYYFSLIKIGDVGPGRITAASLPINRYVIGNNSLVIQNGGAIGSLNVVASTCTTPDVNVLMGDHLLTELKGIGNVTSPAANASFELLNCPAFFGRTSVYSNNGSTSNLSPLGANAISFRIDPTTSVVNAANGVFALRSGGATGIGIQLVNGSNAPVPLQTVLPSDLALRSTNADYTVPLFARYYQTGAVTTAGTANSSVTITLSYL
jgi:type 1 fimbria pilin